MRLLTTLAILVFAGIDGIASTITINGPSEVDGIYGSSVDIVWKIQTDRYFLVLPYIKIYFNSTADGMNELLHLTLYSFYATNNFSKSYLSVIGSRGIGNRVSAVYRYAGNLNGEVVFTINNLQLYDSDSVFFIQAPYMSTTLSANVTVDEIYYGPVICDNGISPQYIVESSKKNIAITRSVCGKPRPNVTCVFEGTRYDANLITNTTGYNFTYTFVLPTSLEACERKELKCVTTGYNDKVLVEYSLVIGSCVFQNLKIVSETVVTGKYKRNVDIIWNIYSSSNFGSFSFRLYKTKKLIENLKFYLPLTDIRSTRMATGQNLSSLTYYYKGIIGGIETGEVVFTINHLQFRDAGAYILTGNLFSTEQEAILNVKYGPEKCGGYLKPHYIVNPREELHVTAGFCAQSEPNIKCTFEGKTYRSSNVQNTRQYEYTYEFVIPTNLKSCERKILKFTAQGSSSDEHVDVIGNVNQNAYKSVIQDTTMSRHTNGCALVTWSTKPETEKCITQYQIDILYRSWIVKNVNITNTYFVVCRMKEVKLLQLSTYTYDFTDDKQWIRKNIFKEYSFDDTDSVPRASGINSVLIITLAAIVTIVLIALLLLIALIKLGRVKLEVIKTLPSITLNQGNVNDGKEASITPSTSSQYMEIQTLQKKYEDLSARQSLANIPQHNSTVTDPKEMQYEHMKPSTADNSVEIQTDVLQVAYQSPKLTQATTNQGEDNSTYEVCS